MNKQILQWVLEEEYKHIFLKILRGKISTHPLTHYTSRPSEMTPARLLLDRVYRVFK